MELTEAELATRAGTDVTMLRRLIQLGIMPPGSTTDEGVVPRVRFAVELEHSGVSLDAVAQLMADGRLSLDFVDRAFLRPIGMVATSFPALAEEAGVSAEFAEAVQVALGIAAGSESDSVREDDAETMDVLAKMVGLGVEEQVMIRLFRIMADSLRKMAGAVSEMWTAGVHQPLLERGLSHRELLGVRSVDSDEFQILGERIVLLLWNRHLEQEISRGTIETLKVALDEAGFGTAAASKPPAIVFLDLTAFTQLTDRKGDEIAAAGAVDLVDVVRRTSVTWGGTLVKMLGDGAMLHFGDPEAAVRCSLAMVDDIAAAGLPPARFGVNAGPIIVQDVDYYGQTVNIAARLVDYARPGEVLVTAGAVEAATTEGVEFTQIGPVSLKGVGSLVEVFSARRA